MSTSLTTTAMSEPEKPSVRWPSSSNSAWQGRAGGVEVGWAVNEGVGQWVGGRVLWVSSKMLLASHDA